MDAQLRHDGASSKEVLVAILYVFGVTLVACEHYRVLLEVAAMVFVMQ